MFVHQVHGVLPLHLHFLKRAEADETGRNRAFASTFRNPRSELRIQTTSQPHRSAGFIPLQVRQRPPVWIIRRQATETGRTDQRSAPNAFWTVSPVGSARHSVLAKAGNRPEPGETGLPRRSQKQRRDDLAKRPIFVIGALSID